MPGALGALGYLSVADSGSRDPGRQTGLSRLVRLDIRGNAVVDVPAGDRLV